MGESEGTILKLLITSVKTQIKNIFTILFTERLGLAIFIYLKGRGCGHLWSICKCITFGFTVKF